MLQGEQSTEIGSNYKNQADKDSTNDQVIGYTPGGAEYLSIL